jgi:hypothetical protein
MGPTQNALEEVKRDAIKGTLRHFRDAMEDNSFVPVHPLDYEMVRADLLDTPEEKQADEPKAEAQPKKTASKKAQPNTEEKSNG